LTQAGVGKDEADIYAESLRRGGAVVSARVAMSMPRVCRRYWIARPFALPTEPPCTGSPAGRHSIRMRPLTRRTRCARSVAFT